jgi:leucyl-tRNA synthetase
VEQRLLAQWFFRISDYAQRLLDNLGGLDWSDSTRTAQRNWIGKSEGAEIRFRIAGGGSAAGGRGSAGDADSDLVVFTTRPDTIFGATYMVLAPEHPLVEQLTTPERLENVEAYRDGAARQDIVARKVSKDKTGVFTGSYVINPATGGEIPIWIADYVLMDYGTGAIMAVPGHDERDFEFARVFRLPIVRVIAPEGADVSAPLDEAFVDDAGAHLVNSGQFDGMPVAVAKRAVTDWLANRNSASAVVNYRLHDWCISRQRYWGPPIPVIHCDACGPQAVPESDLPVLLPDIPDFKPDDTGVSPLARHEQWYRVKCPACGGEARRETDVSDTFLDSAWYFLRYPSAQRDDVPFDASLTRKWLPVTSYIGGNEHAVLHMMYARFITMVLHDMGHLDFEEPFVKFRAHGHIIRDGAKMSKTKGNIVNPDQYFEQWGADTFRMYLMFLGPFQEGGDFRDAGISGVRSFLNRLWLAVIDAREDGTPDNAVLRKLHQTIRKVGEDTARLGYNTAVAAMMEYMNVLRKGERVPHRDEVLPLVQLVAPYAPHIAEELWERLGQDGSVMDAGWPRFDEALAREDTIQVAVQVNGKLRGALSLPLDVDQVTALAAAMGEPSIAKFVTGEPRKVVFVPGRLLNLVI